MDNKELEKWEAMLRAGAYDALLESTDTHKTGNPEVLFLRAMATARLRKHTEALELFNALLDMQPDRAEILSERAVVYLHLKKKSLCLLDFNRALNVQPKNPYRYASRAYAREFFGDIEGAISDYEEALALDPEDAVAYNNLGLLQEKLGYKLKAEKNFQKADKLNQMLSEWDRKLPEEDNAEEPNNEIANPDSRQLWKTAWQTLSRKEGRRDFWRWLRKR